MGPGLLNNKSGLRVAFSPAMLCRAQLISTVTWAWHHLTTVHSTPGYTLLSPFLGVDHTHRHPLSPSEADRELRVPEHHPLLLIRESCLSLHPHVFTGHWLISTQDGLKGSSHAQKLKWGNPIVCFTSQSASISQWHAVEGLAVLTNPEDTVDPAVLGCLQLPCYHPVLFLSVVRGVHNTHIHRQM